MPGLDCVVAGGYVVDGEGSGGAARCEVRVTDDPNEGCHPPVYIAGNPQHDLGILQMQLLHDSGLGLADVEGIPARGSAMHVVVQLVTVPNLYRLADLRA